MHTNYTQFSISPSLVKHIKASTSSIQLTMNQFSTSVVKNFNLHAQSPLINILSQLIVEYTQLTKDYFQQWITKINKQFQNQRLSNNYVNDSFVIRQTNKLKQDKCQLIKQLVDLQFTRHNYSQIIYKDTTLTDQQNRQLQQIVPSQIPINNLQIDQDVVQVREQIQDQRQHLHLKDNAEIYDLIKIEDSMKALKITQTIQQQKDYFYPVTVKVQQIEEREIVQNKGICSKHYYQYLYKSNQSQYCNRCIREIGNLKERQKYKICCILHKQQIIYQIKQSQQILPQSILIVNQEDQENDGYQTEEAQTKSTTSTKTKQTETNHNLRQYFCSLCPEITNTNQATKSTDKKYILTSTCHYLPLFKICHNIQCINNNSFEICNLCYRYHQDHQTIDIQSMHQYHQIDSDLEIQKYYKKYKDTQSCLQLQPITSKIISRKMQKLQPLISYLHSFVGHQNQKQLLSRVLTKRDKKALTQLRYIKKLLNMKLDGQKRLRFLQAIKYWIHNEVQKIEYNINESIEPLHKYSQALINLTYEDITFHHRQRYEVIIIRNQISYSLDGNELDSILPLSSLVVQNAAKITIDQTQTNINLQNSKFKRQAIFKQVKIKHTKQYHKLRKILLHLAGLENINLEQYSFEETQMISNCRYQLEQIQKGLITSFQNTPLFRISELNFECLKVLKINYPNNRWNHPQFTISAFILFKIVRKNQYLQQICINGVMIEQFDKFMRNFRINKIKQASFQDDDFEKYQGESEDSNWIKNRAFQTRIRMSLNIELYFFFKHSEVVSQKIQDLEQLLRFVDLSNIKFMLGLQKTEDVQQLSHLLCIMNKMKNIRIYIGQLNYSLNILSQTDPFYYLISSLTKFTQIIQLQFKGLFLQLQQESLNKLQSFFNSIFSQNQIGRMVISQCSGFPNLKNLQTLESIKIIYSRFRYSFNNTNLRSIQLAFTSRKITSSSHRINFSNLHKLQILDIKYCDYIDDSSLNSLTSASCQTLRYLAIWNNVDQSVIPASGNKRATKYSIKEIFPCLKRIQCIDLSNIHFSSKTLLSVPSQNLKELYIYANKQLEDCDFADIGTKWPNLIQLRIGECPNITPAIFNNWKFNDLVELKMNKNVLNNSNKLMQLIRKGTKVKFYETTPLKDTIRDVSLQNRSKTTKEPSLRNILQSMSLKYNDWPNDYSLESISCTGLQKLTIGNNNNKFVTSKALEGIIPKLKDIKYLCLWNIDFDGELLLNIPSFTFTSLHILSNKQITNQNIQRIYRAFQNIKYLTILGCNKINGQILLICKFKGLKQLTIDKHILEESYQVIQIVNKIKQKGLKIKSVFQYKFLKPLGLKYAKLQQKKKQEFIQIKQISNKSIKEEKRPQIEINTNKKELQIKNNVGDKNNTHTEQRPKNPHLKKKQIQVIQITPSIPNTPNSNREENSNNIPQQKCKKHGQQIHYFSKQQNRKYCDKCIQFQSHLINKKAQITCKKHNKMIMYKHKDGIKKKINIVKVKEISSPQNYMCIQCLNSKGSTQEDIRMILKCHVGQIKQICTNQLCIQNNTFIICPICNYQEHELHQKVPFQRKEIVQMYGFKKQQYLIAETLFKNNKQSKNKDIICKLNNLIDDQSKQICLFKQYLQFLSIESDTQIEQIVSSLLLQGQNKHIIVLQAINQVKKKLKGVNEEQIIQDHLKNIQQIIIDTMQSYLNINYNQLHQLSKSLHSKISYYLHQNMEVISNKIDDKYKTLVNIYKQQATLLCPMNLTKIDQLHNKRISNIIVQQNKWTSNGSEISKEMRINFLNYEYWNIIQQFNLNQRQKHKILQLFLQYEQTSQVPQQYQGFIKVVEAVKQKFIQSQSKLVNQLPFSYIINRRITNLINISIKYALNHEGSYLYSIESFQFFRVVNLNKMLKNILVEGVQVINFQQFIKFFMGYKDNYTLEHTVDQEKLALYINWNEQLEAIVYTKYEPQIWKQVKDINLQELCININASLTIKHNSNHYKTSHQLRNISNFIRQFRQIGGIQLMIDLQQITYLNDRIIELVTMIKKIKLNITSKQSIDMLTDYDEFYLLLKSLSHLEDTHITSITFKNIQFKTKNVKMLKEIQRYINQIITKNGSRLKQIRLFKCIRFPSFQVAQVPQLYISDSTFCEGLTSNPLDYFVLPYFPQNLLINSSFINEKSISILANNQLSLLKSITLNGIKQVYSEKCLTDLFYNLSNICYLSLSNINVKGSHLELTRSPYIRQLHLYACNSIKSESIIYIGRKWSNLQQLTINLCQNISSSCLNEAKFHKLCILNLGQRLYKESRQVIKKLKMKGLLVKCLVDS